MGNFIFDFNLSSNPYFVKNGIESKWKCDIFDGENEIGINEWNMEDEILNANFQIKQNTTKEITNLNENNEMEKKTFKHRMFKGRYGKVIIRMQFVRMFIMWMMTKKLILEAFKSWDVCCMFLIQTQKEEKDL